MKTTEQLHTLTFFNSENHVEIIFYCQTIGISLRLFDFALNFHVPLELFTQDGFQNSMPISFFFTAVCQINGNTTKVMKIFRKKKLVNKMKIKLSKVFKAKDGSSLLFFVVIFNPNNKPIFDNPRLK